MEVVLRHTCRLQWRWVSCGHPSPTTLSINANVLCVGFDHALVQRCASALTVAALLCVVGASPLWDYVHKFDPNYSYVLRCDAGHCVLFYTFHKHAMDSTLVCRSAQIAVDGDGTSVCPVTSFRLIISLSTSSCACNRYFDTGIRINTGSNTGWT